MHIRSSLCNWLEKRFWGLVFDFKVFRELYGVQYSINVIEFAIELKLILSGVAWYFIDFWELERDVSLHVQFYLYFSEELAH